MLKTIRIVYKDDYLLVVEKPPGLLTVPTPKNEKATLTNILRDEGFKVYPCHRLDRDTSGLIMFARDKDTLRKMREQYRNQRIKKTYIAVLQGKLKKKTGTITSDIVKKGRRKSARTDYRILKSNVLFSVAEVYPVTGRTNQIRLHFRHIGHPLVGERKFFLAKKSPVKFRRTALHAKGLEFRHPYNGKIIRLESSLPKDMQNLLQTASPFPPLTCSTSEVEQVLNSVFVPPRRWNSE